MTCTRCEAQGRVISKLARDLAEARIALAAIRDITSVAVAGDYREIHQLAQSQVPLAVDPST